MPAAFAENPQRGADIEPFMKSTTRWDRTSSSTKASGSWSPRGELGSGSSSKTGAAGRADAGRSDDGRGRSAAPDPTPRSLLPRRDSRPKATSVRAGTVSGPGRRRGGPSHPVADWRSLGAAAGAPGIGDRPRRTTDRGAAPGRPLALVLL